MVVQAVALGIAMQLVAAGAITEDHGMLTPSNELARAFEPGQLFALDS